MKVRDLYERMDMWTSIKVVTIEEEELFSGLMAGLETGIKEEGCENVLFDEEMEKILNYDVIGIDATGELKVTITVK